ncbi:MAG: TRAP transporter small permease [Limnobacter sp.]|nr:TRAP transporter small permease [Limnobacter sp.]
MRILEILAKFTALFAGTALMLVAAIVCGSIFSRQFFGAALLGDFELVQFGMAFSVASFMPLCQLRRGNIIVDFFTLRASARTRDLLDRVGCLLLAGMCSLLAWRSLLGGLSAREYNSVTMLLQLPEWIAFVAMVPPLILTAVIALVQAFGPAPAADDDLPGIAPATGTRDI